MQSFIGRSRRDTDEVSLSICRRVASLLDIDPFCVNADDVLPLGWAAGLFADLSVQSQIGPDGHAERGDFLPPVALPKRRFAGREVEVHGPLRIGAAVERRSTIAAIEPKQGRSGPLVFVTVVHQITSNGEAALTERQTIAYLGAEGAGRAPSGPRVDFMPEPKWTTTFHPDPVALFRYSAITFNAHRIHYDLPYATSVEGYPGLVVNGGLTTLLLLDLAQRSLQRRVTGYRIRAMAPLFEGRTISLNGRAASDGAQFWAADDGGGLAMVIDVQTG